MRRTRRNPAADLRLGRRFAIAARSSPPAASWASARLGSGNLLFRYLEKNTEDGFTLTELLVVLVILGLLSALIAPQVIKYLTKAKSDTAALQIKNIMSILDLYNIDTGDYPTESEGLKALVQKPADSEFWNGPYIQKQEMLLDPWRREYLYKFPGAHGPYDLYSLGADGVEGGEGGEGENKDLTSW